MKIILIIALFFCTCAISNEPIVVNIETENQLLPLYLSPLLDEESGFAKEYLKKVEDILHFDLNFNGMTYVVKPTKETIAIDSSISFQAPQNLSSWKKHRIYYSIKPRIANKQLGLKLLLVNQDAVKQIDGISLTGILSEDRKKIHLLADVIYKTLFNQEGIAQTRLMYTVKMKSGTTEKAISEVVTSDYDGGNLHVVTDQKALCVSPCYIPAKPGFIAKNFAYVSYKTGQPKIYFSSLDEGKSIRFSLIKGNQFMPAFSQACDKIAFICDVTGNPDLFVQDLDAKGPIGKPMQLFTATYGTQATPTFSPDGKKIAFVSNKDGSPRIYITTIPSSSLQKPQATLLTKQNRENTSPCWSPDGKKIAYAALSKGVRQIWVYDFETGKEKQITDGPHHKENPTFAPNSLHIAFNSTEGDQAEIYLLNLRQPKAVKITSGKGDKRFPSWEPRN